ncbi:MAG: undecaprenyldiphospho-muramoylpentapeptide beta-N-acetylglucosaminyltransferase [Firmicutes bacterium]|nr:undecaprenyldiphospho-muramoylpentapeptide beta-N-acetylglucosaminyltransferase [Bacillota bacterium]
MRVIISGGGTGGHIYPALSIADELRRSGADVLYMGGRGSAEEKLAAEYGFAFAAVSTSPLHRHSLKAAADLLTNAKGMAEAKKIIRDFRADAAVGTGGFVTAPVLMAADSLHIPTMIHEQNASPGLANRRLAKKAAAVCLTFKDAAGHFPGGAKLHYTGLPVRPQILAAAKETPPAAYAEFAIPAADRDCPTLLITGGSQGAQSLNQAAAAAYEELLAVGIRIIHLCGRKNYEELKAAAPQHPHLILLPYLERMEYAMSLADLALARAGASFLAEAAVMGLPALLVPYPFATNDHQQANADEFAEAGAAVVIADGELNGDVLAKQARAVLEDKERSAAMKAAALSLAKPDAAKDIARIAMEIARNR